MQQLCKSSGASIHSGRKPNPKTSGLESFTQSSAWERISAKAAQLITGARRPNTSFTYKSAWRKWVIWWGERKINPHSCHLQFVLEFFFKHNCLRKNLNTLRLIQIDQPYQLTMTR